MYRGDQLPELEGYDGVVLLGGTMNAEDDARHPYLPDVVALLQEALRRAVPVLGICLGGQLLARAVGARIWRKPAAEIGYFPIRLTEAGRADPLFQGLGDELLTLQWHYDAFDVPAGATLLADSPRDSAQAFRLGSCHGLQFHPEVTPEMVAQWSTWNPAALGAAAQPTTREKLLDTAFQEDERFAAQTRQLCENWLKIVADRAAGR